MALHDQFFAQFCRHPKILSVVRELLGNDVKLLQSMCLLKPPGKWAGLKDPPTASCFLTFEVKLFWFLISVRNIWCLRLLE